jgi:hypothetical protein
LTEISEALSKTKFMYSSKPCDFLQSKLPVRKSADLWQRYNAYDNLSLDPKIRLLVKPNLYPCLTLQIPKDQILKGEMVSHNPPMFRRRQLTIGCVIIFCLPDMIGAVCWWLNEKNPNVRSPFCLSERSPFF